ncbi:hypothetical protein DICPUDRAFT_89862 [Dictyostelium purpureum]|uniref:RNA polymerase II nuclear localization protein SLC7A6OS n=1 Tax=Dictyostelium purpureum TaxID=5786 RepID=F0ZYN7_DICPU|nr:uncharacterized protein DICPUDRAFT_89862 [Dictyostelium purpureum]EGC30944.1 hypothetical protein DICPUDRAFT_89862 [Dictyostelium purpureum]|eukprot:XP_003292521.1 hypothetical protein DICPUDRAFT_89862 [Dictyostelium purpureum]
MKSNNENNNNNKTIKNNIEQPQNGKKIFAPNIPNKMKRKTENIIFTPEMVLNPTKSELKNREQPKLQEVSTSPPQYHYSSSPPPLITNESKNIVKPVILKIKRKIDDDALPSILIERPKKKAFLDTFKDFGIDDKDDKLISEITPASPPKKEEIKEEIKTPPIKDKKLFTLVTTLDDPTANSNKLLSKFQQRLEQFNNKGVISSPKQLESKKERTNKKRKESRYKQININRNLLSKEERELFQNHDIIELERTIIDHDNILNSALSKEEEALISDYRSMLEEHFNSASVPATMSSETKYVYDYYYFDPTIDQHMLDQADPDSIETVELPPEDDFYDILDGCDSDESSVDSENWYREYPSSEDDQDDGYDDFDNYHRSNRIVNSDEDDYEYDEYDGDFYNQDDYDDNI